MKSKAPIEYPAIPDYTVIVHTRRRCPKAQTYDTGEMQNVCFLKNIVAVAQKAASGEEI